MPSTHLSAVAIVMMLAACGDDDRGTPQTCKLECERAAECDAVLDARSCARACGTGPAPQPRLSDKYLDAVRRCLHALPCSEPGLWAASQECAQDAALRLTASKEANELCRRAQSADRTCGLASLDPIHCLDDVKLYHDDVLRDAKRCYDGPCSTHAACVRELLGDPYWWF